MSLLENPLLFIIIVINFTKFASTFGTISLASLQVSIKIVNGTWLYQSKYGTISKASRKDTCWFVAKFVISVDCIGRLLFDKISSSDFLEVEYECENFSESRACSIFPEFLSVIWLILSGISSITCCVSKFGLLNIVEYRIKFYHTR